jgi:hypothetical protein
MSAAARAGRDSGTNALRITGAKPGSRIVLRFDQPEDERTHWVAGRSYQARWRGDTVVQITPHGETYPIFSRLEIDRDRAPNAAVGCFLPSVEGPLVNPRNRGSECDCESVVYHLPVPRYAQSGIMMCPEN